ncbi:MAG: TolC family protein [Prevotellaceae bacterium]|nr:TolC family protein [Prevotellaceae bacterium]
MMVAVLLAMFGMGRSLAQDATTALPSQWTLKECIAYAMEHNIQLKQRRLTTEQSELDVLQSQASLFPSLSFSTNQNVSWRPWSQSYVNLSNGTMTTTSSEVNYNGSYGLNANWTVWNGGRNQKTVERNRLTRESSLYDTEETANSIQEQIVQYYVQILYQTEAVRVNGEVLEASKLQRDRAKVMVDVGSIARVDLMQLEAQVSQDEYNVVNAQTMLDNYKLQLKQLLEIVDVEAFDIVIPDVGDADVLAMIPDRESVYAAAVNSRPEIQSGLLDIEAADVDIDIAKRGYYPSVSLMAGVGTSNTSGVHTGVPMQWKNNLNNSVGLTLSVPIFDNRQNKTNVAKARLSKQACELNLQNTKKELRSQIETYWLNARNAQQQYRSATTNVESMQASYDLVSEQFRLGLKNIVELTTGKNNLLQARQQLLQSKYTALLNLAMLRFYANREMQL